MTTNNYSTQTIKVLADNQEEILKRWVDAQLNDRRIRASLFDRQELMSESRAFIETLIAATAVGNVEIVDSPEYEPCKNLLIKISAHREQQGFTPFETAFSFICFKDTWVIFLESHFKDAPNALGNEVVVISKLIDTLGLVTLDGWSKRREEIISRQTREILELSVPIVQVWEGIVVASLVGTLDTQRAERFTEGLLNSIVTTGSSVALVDITGVAEMDTRSAQHLFETISAVRLVGAQIVLTGMSLSTAQTLVKLGIKLTGVITRSSLGAGLRLALDMVHLQVVSKD